MKELIELFEARRHAPDIPYAVATVLRVEGSSYRRPGARMLVNVHGRVAGSVSGGCLEKNVISEARKTLLDGHARLLSFNTTDQDDLAMGSSLGCEGKIWIGIEPLPCEGVWPLETLMEEVREQRRPAALLTHIGYDGDQVRFSSAVIDAGGVGRELSGPWQQEIDEVFRSRKNRFVGTTMSGAALIEWCAPPIALLLFGAGHDVPPLVKLAHDLGHEITVIDRRPDFAVPEQFPGANRVIAAKPQQVPALLRPDDRTVAVVMNHHYETDRDVLAALLPLGLFYIAVLGPRRRTDRILSELGEMGVTPSEAALASIHAPAGLDLGGENPEQIALAILAEIQAAMAGRDGGMLKLRNKPIHAERAVKETDACSARV